MDEIKQFNDYEFLTERSYDSVISFISATWLIASFIFHRVCHLGNAVLFTSWGFLFLAIVCSLIGKRLAIHGLRMEQAISAEAIQPETNWYEKTALIGRWVSFGAFIIGGILLLISGMI